MGWPSLDQHHIACDETCSICPTSCICATPEDDCAITVGWITEDLVELHGKAVQVTDMQWAEVVVKSVVQKGVINGEVDRRGSYSDGCGAGGVGSRGFLVR